MKASPACLRSKLRETMNASHGVRIPAGSPSGSPQECSLRAFSLPALRHVFRSTPRSSRGLPSLLIGVWQATVGPAHSCGRRNERVAGFLPMADCERTCRIRRRGSGSAPCALVPLIDEGQLVQVEIRGVASYFHGLLQEHPGGLSVAFEEGEPRQSGQRIR